MGSATGKPAEPATDFSSPFSHPHLERRQGYGARRPLENGSETRATRG